MKKVSPWLVDAKIFADNLKSLLGSYLRILFDYLPAENYATILHQAIPNALKNSVTIKIF